MIVWLGGALYYTAQMLDRHDLSLGLPYVGLLLFRLIIGIPVEAQLHSKYIYDFLFPRWASSFATDRPAQEVNMSNTQNPSLLLVFRANLMNISLGITLTICYNVYEQERLLVCIRGLFAEILLYSSLVALLRIGRYLGIVKSKRTDTYQPLSIKNLIIDWSIVAFTGLCLFYIAFMATMIYRRQRLKHGSRF